MSLLHDIDSVVHSHPRDNLHQDLDNILSPVLIVIVQDDTKWRGHFPGFPAAQTNAVISGVLSL
jgi:hypothetical protein